MRFGQGLIQGLINPGYGRGLFEAGQSMGSAPGRMRQAQALQQQQEEERRRKQQEAQLTAFGEQATARAEALRQQQRGMLLGNIASGGGDAQLYTQAAARAGIPVSDIKATVDIAKIQREAAKEQKAEDTRSVATNELREVLATELETVGQNGYANVIRKVPDPSQLPAEVQKRIFESIGLTAEEGVEAMSPAGKLAVDLGYKPGTQEFRDTVGRIFSAENSGTSVERIEGAHGMVKDLVDVKKNQSVNEAVVALSSRGRAGSEALSENAIVSLFGDKLRAEAAVNRFASSASLGRRIGDSVRLWALGEKTNLTAEDRNGILYAFLKQQEASINGAVTNSSRIYNMSEEEKENFRQIYSFPTPTQEWIRRYEAKYRESTNVPTSSSSASSYIEEARRRFGNQ